MKYLLKIFVVSVLTCCVTTRVSCATKGASGDRDFVVKVTDYKGNPLPFITLKTKKYEAETNIKGYATFKNACQAFQDAKVVKVTISDSSGRNYEQKIPTSNAFGCSYDMKLPQLTTKMYAPADQIPLTEVKGTKKTKFYNLCETGTKIPSGVKGGCVKTFDKVNTQYEIGKALAQEYVYEYFKLHKGVGANSDPKITCSSEIRKSNNYLSYNDDYLSCATVDGKYVFEFQFDDLYESWGNDIRYTTLEGLCTLYGGSISPKPYTYCKGEQIKTEELCKKLNRVSKTFSFSTVYDKGNCYVTFKIKGADETAKSYSVLRYDVFQNYQTKFDNSTKVLIGRYVESTLGSDFESLECASMPVTWYRKYRIDDIIECVLTTKNNGSYNIEFVFDDLYELADNTSQGDTSKMGCLVDGGKYVAGKCAGVSLEQCNALKSQLGVNTRFNRELQMCELPDANRQDNNRKGLDALVAAGSIVLAAVTIVGTGGAAAPAVLVVAAKVGAAASILNSGLSLYTMDVEDHANSEANKLMVLINNCGCETDCTNGKCKACATCKYCKYREIYRNLPSVLKNADDEYVELLDEKLKSIKPCIEPEDIKGLEAELLNGLKKEGLVKDTLKGIKIATGLMSILAPGGGNKAVVNTATKASRTKKVENTVNKLFDAAGKVDTVTGIAVSSDSTSTTQPTKGK